MNKTWLEIVLQVIITIIVVSVLFNLNIEEKSEPAKVEISIKEIPINWELLKSPPNEDNIQISRASVPGGWLIVSSKYSATANIFIPDPEHTWFADLEK